MSLIQSVQHSNKVGFLKCHFVCSLSLSFFFCCLSRLQFGENWFSAKAASIVCFVGNKVHKFIASINREIEREGGSVSVALNVFGLCVNWQQGNEIRKSDTNTCIRALNGCCQPECNSIIKCFQRCNWINGFALISLSLHFTRSLALSLLVSLSIDHPPTRSSSSSVILMAIICSMFTMCTLKWIKMQYHA